MSHILGRHRWMLIAAVFVGCVSAMPVMLAPFLLGSQYRGVQFLPLDNEDNYRARIHEVLDGHFSASSTYLFEYKDVSAPVFAVNEWVYAAPAYLFGLSNTIVASKFIFPAMLFLLVYALLWRILGKTRDATLAAITGGLVVVLGYDFVDYRTMLGIMNGTAIPPFPVWTRLVNPIVGGLLLFGVLNLLWSMIERRRYAFVGVGVLIALSVGYFFNFALSLAIVGAVFLVSLWQKQYALARECLYALLISAVLDAWYWFSMFSSVGGVDGRVLAMRNGMFVTHEPVVNMMLLATTLFVAGSFLFAWRTDIWKENRAAWGFIAALLLGSWAAFNQQIITGRSVWHYHFVQYVIPLCMISVLAVSYLVWREYILRVWRGAMILFCSVTVVYAVYVVFSVSNRLDEFQAEQRYAEVFEYLEKAQPECVVMVLGEREKLERLIPAYTDCNVYSTSSIFFGVSEERVLHNFLISLRFENVASEDVRDYLLQHEESVRVYFFSDWKQLFGSGHDAWFLEKIEYLTREYQLFFARNFEDELLKYKLDFVVSEHPINSDVLQNLPGLHIAATSTNFYFYSL